MRKPSSLPNWDDWIDQQIRDAQERGEFDNLPGSGQPLDLAQNPFALDREMAFKILQDAGGAPEWIELDKRVREKAEVARRSLAQKRQWCTGRLDELADRSDSWAQAERERVEGSWSQAINVFEEQVEAINRDITELNLKVPSPRFQRRKMVASDEISCLTGL